MCNENALVWLVFEEMQYAFSFQVAVDAITLDDENQNQKNVGPLKPTIVNMSLSICCIMNNNES